MVSTDTVRVFGWYSKFLSVAVMHDRSTRRGAVDLSTEYRGMLRLVQLLHGSSGQEASAEFIERLQARLFSPPATVTRPRAVLSALGTLAAGLVAGVGLERAVQPGVSWDERTFECPSHGAEFDLHGNLRYRPRKYGLPLPSLPPLRTRVRGETVEVFSV